MSIMSELGQVTQSAVAAFTSRHHLAPNAGTKTETVEYAAAQVTVWLQVIPVQRAATIQVFFGTTCIAFLAVDGAQVDIIQPCLASELPLVLAAITAAAQGERILTIAGDIAA